MQPEHNQTKIDVWVLVKLTIANTPKGGFGKPYTIMTDSDVYMSLAEAQQAQTWEALKNGISYSIFHLEFPL